ncbi:MAG: hypothetical protein RL207_364 [Bacteroidota bacterium]|jgi:hypothetical protein
MEDHLKNIIKKHEAFAELNDLERTQLVEWCADEQEFQSLKKLFQHVDVWSDKPTDDSNTKIRLDQLFAMQYAGKQSTSNGREIQFAKNRFSRIASWASIPAVAAALVLMWFMYQPNKEVTLAKNDVKTPIKEKKVQVEKQEELKLNGGLNIPSAVFVESSNEETPKEIASVEGKLPELTDNVADVELVAPTVSWSSSLANGSSATLSATNTGAVSYSWSANDLSEAKVMSSKKVSTEKISSGKKRADAFTSMSVKSMPEMLDVIVSAY